MNMAAKRTIHQDPEYVLPVEFQAKRIKLVEDNARKHTEKKIEEIIKSNFEQELPKKHAEIDTIDELLHEARCMLDRLRACAITKYYANLVQEQVPNEQPSSSIHPTVKKYLSKSPKHIPDESAAGLEDSTQVNENSSVSQGFQFNNQISLNPPLNKVTNSDQSPSKNYEEVSTRAPRFKRKCKIVIGNISKFIPKSRRDGSDLSTHKWMVYVRGDKDHPNIDSFVKKVIFFLHPSYRPSDKVEISNPPFHLIKRGWGEFPIRVQIYFHDPRNKPIDAIHNLKLDKTFTGLQTLGGETVLELQLFKPDDGKSNSANDPLSSVSASPASRGNSITTVTCNGSVFSESLSEQTSNVHIIKKEPDSLVMNIKLPKAVNNDAKSDQISNVNNHNLSSKDSIQSDLNSKKKIVPKLVISNNRVTTKSSNDKPLTVTNGLNTTFVKCKDNEGRVLLVPQSSLTFKSPSNLVKQNNIPQTNSSVDSTSSQAESNENKTVPSYILKVVPNQNSGQNQVFLIPLSEKKAKSTVTKPLSEIQTDSHVEHETKEKSETLCNVASLFKKNPQLLTDFELDSIRLDYYKSFEELLKRVCKIFPLVKSDVDRSVFPFCAKSLEEFHTWNIGKQRASEWRRAGAVRKAILKLLERRGCTHISPDSVWPQSSIMSWCRKNGFVPMATEKITLLPEPKWSGVELCSLTNPDNLISSLPEEKYTPVFSDDEEEIDIVNVAEEKTPSTSATNKQEACYLPHLSDASPFIKQTASQVGIDIKPVELEPNVHIPVVEEMLLSVCLQLASDLVGSSLTEGFKRLGGKICPEEVTVSDVYSAIKNTPKFDLFSNSSLGLPKDQRGNT